MSTTRRTLLVGATSLSAVAAVPLSTTQASRAEPVRAVKRYDGFSAPVGMAFDAAGNLYVAEWSAGRVSRIAADGTRKAFATGLEGPAGLAIGPDGAIYVGSYARDEIYHFTPEGQRSVFVEGLATPAGIGFDRSGRLLIANRRTNQVLAVTADRRLLPVISDLQTPVGVVQKADGGYVVANIAGGITIVRVDGSRVEAGQGFRAPGAGIVQTSGGRVFVADYGGTTVREILMSGSSQAVADGFSSPVGLVLTPDQTALLTATWGDGSIYQIDVPQ